MGFLRAEVSVFVDSAREQVLHQAGLDALLLGDQRLGLLNSLIDRRENFGDLGPVLIFRVILISNSEIAEVRFEDLSICLRVAPAMT